MEVLHKSVRIVFLTVILILAQHLKAQSYLSLDAAQVFSTFKFSSDDANNSTAPGSGYSTITTTAFGAGYVYADSGGLIITAGLGVRKAGSALVLNRVNYTWNLQYLDIKAGVGYQYNKWKLRPYILVSPFFSQLLNAKQTIGLNYYDIKSTNTIKSNDFGLFLTAGFSVPVSRFVSIYLDYNYILGLRNLETTESQYLYNRASAFRLGLLFNISAAKAKEQQELLAKKDTVFQIVKAEPQDSDKIKETGIAVKNPDTVKTIKKDIPVKSDSVKTVQKDIPVKSDTLKTISNNIKTTSDTLSSPDKINKETVKTDTLSNTKIVTQKDPLQNATEQDKLNENQLKNISKIADNQNIIFKIQLVAVKSELKPNNSLLKNVLLPVKKEKGDDGWFRYYTGSFKTYEKALTELNKIKSNGVTDAFIVAFKDGKKITVTDAKNILK
ncbi:MAG: outer membrane beta-barrel protein [Bacteroidia bacterium]